VKPGLSEDEIRERVLRGVSKVRGEFASSGPELPAPVYDRRGVQLRRLSPREREMIIAASHGLTNAETGAMFFLSEHTVKTHWRRILPKLAANNRTHAVAIALRETLIP
jgi:DNA-binding CsgD family transcriptional regulator